MTNELPIYGDIREVNSCGKMKKMPIDSAKAIITAKTIITPMASLPVFLATNFSNLLGS